MTHSQGDHDADLREPTDSGLTEPAVSDDALPELPDLDIDLVVFDLTGTIVDDHGVQRRAFEAAYCRAAGIDTADDRLPKALATLDRMRGVAKIEVYSELFDDESAANWANSEFENAYAALIAEERIDKIPGTEEIMASLREIGVKTAIISSFSRPTVNAMLEQLGWEQLADVTITPAEAGRGRPYPDLPLTALLRTHASSVQSMVVVGDTPSDMLMAQDAGAGLIIGVTTSGTPEEALYDYGADMVVGSVDDLLNLFTVHPHAEDEASVDEDAAARTLREHSSRRTPRPMGSDDEFSDRDRGVDPLDRF